MSVRHRVAAIGTAWAAKVPLPCFQKHPDVELVSVCSGRIARAEEAAKTFGASGATPAYDDYARMIAETDADIVYIGGPVHLHHPMALAAARAGKHIVCEKPLAESGAKGLEMLQAAEEAKVAHMLALTMRAYPGPVSIKRLVEEGALGDVRHVSIQGWFSMPPGMPRIFAPLNDAAQGGGILNAMGVHYIDLVRWWLGDFSSVSGELRTWRTQMPDASGAMREVTADDSFVMQGRLQNGASISLQMSSELAPSSGPRVELYGSEGSVVLDGMQSLRFGSTSDKALEELAFDVPQFSDAAHSCPSPGFGEVITRLLQWMDNGETQTPNMRDGLRAQQVIDALRVSNEERREVAVSTEG